MLAAVVLASFCAVVLAAPQFPMAPDSNNPTMDNMFKALDVQSMVKTFDPKFVVVHDQQGAEMPMGIKQALVKSLISDLHNADVPVVYAQKRDLPFNADIPML